LQYTTTPCPLFALYGRTFQRIEKATRSLAQVLSREVINYVSKTSQPVEKVGVGPLEDLELGFRAPNLGILVLREGRKKACRGFFNTLSTR
jgi:hypothetical protein